MNWTEIKDLYLEGIQKEIIYFSDYSKPSLWSRDCNETLLHLDYELKRKSKIQQDWYSIW